MVVHREAFAYWQRDITQSVASLESVGYCWTESSTLVTLTNGLVLNYCNREH